MMRNLSKTLSITTIAGIVTFALLSPLLSLAASAFLPICGHNSLSNSPSVTSGPPDMARSQNAAQTYTAVVWAEGNSGIGSIKLVYSNVATTIRFWSNMTVDSGTSNKEPSIVFDPASSNVVHVAYQKGNGVGNSGITYAKCTLGGSCTTRNINTGAANRDRSNARIAVNAAGDPVIVFQETDTGSSTTYLYHAYIGTDGTGTIQGPLRVTSSSDKEQNPTVAYANDIVHVAYAADTTGDGTPDVIKYTQLNVSGELSGKGGASLTITDNNQTFGLGAGMSKPDFPALDAIGGGTIALVWEVEETTSNFHLVYDISHNNGVDWQTNGGGTDQYRYILSNNRSHTDGGKDASLDDRPSSESGEFTQRLRPDVTLHMSGSITITHVAWHEETNGRRDIMYSYFDGSEWRGTPVLTIPTPPISFTNVTTVYGESEAGLVGFGLDKARPKILYGKPGNRLQVVYVSQTSGSDWDVVYNGWQLGEAGNPDPDLQVQDSDCDTLPDTIELPDTPACPDGAFRYDTNGDEDSDYAYNCNANQDGVPDFLDTNSDGDFQTDDVDSNWREFSSEGGVFLPIILKNS